MDEFEEILRLNALREEIIKRYEAGERNFASADLRKISIRYPCFMDVNFSGVNLEESSFNAIYLVNTSFSCANLERAAFSTSLINCNLINTNLREASFRYADLTGTDLTGADLSGADLRETKLIGCNLRNANLTGIRTTEGTIFCDTIMPDGRIETNSPKVLDAQELLKRYADGERDFRDIILHRVDLSGANLRAVNLCGAYFSHVNLQGAILEGEDVSAEFVCCDMSDIQLISTIPDNGHHPRFCCSDLRRAQLGWFDWCGSKFIGNNFQGAKGIGDYGIDGPAFIHNTIWDGGSFVAGPTWGLRPLNFRDIDPSSF